MRTVFVAASDYRGFADTEIRGYVDGEYKFERNVATQYHVRIGCEGSSPLKGRYEVMRVLQRWDVSTLPAWARILEARMVLTQEDCSRFPYRYPLRWPTDFLLFEVKKPWGPGRGGVRGDNQSRPERGDAWWCEARAGELAWREPGCGYASDEDPEADHAAHPLAGARLSDVTAPLCFEGPRFTGAVQRALEGDGVLSLLLRASSTDEVVPGSVKTFFSGEFGDDLGPASRPRLEVRWTAPCLAFERHDFVLEPGTEVTIHPRFASQASRAGVLVAASLSMKKGTGVGGTTEPAASPRATSPLEPVVRLALSDGEPSLIPLSHPACSNGSEICAIDISTALNPVPAGEKLSIRLLETWTPSVSKPEDLEVRVRFTAPSRRSVEVNAEYSGPFLYCAELQPDELGVWSYEWRARPDSRFETQRGEGFFTVVLGERPQDLEALKGMVAAAVTEAASRPALVARRRCHFRLVALQKSVRQGITAVQTSPSESASLQELRDLLSKIAAVLPAVE